jgi:hypothetical protein
MEEILMSNQMISYCGIDCSICPAYIATQKNDTESLTKLAGEWFEGSTDYSIVVCDGCKSDQLMKWCQACPTRACSVERELENCAYCWDYGCKKLLTVFEMSAEAKANLDRIRAAL